MTTPLSTLEGIERIAWLDVSEAAPDQDLSRRLGHERVGDALVLRLSGVHAPMLNRVLGLGGRWCPSDEELDRILAGYRDRGIDAWLAHVSPGPSAPRTREMLEARGLVRFPRSWCKLTARDLRPMPVQSSLALDVARPGDAPRIAAILSAGFEIHPEVGRVLAAVADRPRWHVLVARQGHEVIAVGTLFVQGRAGYLAFAATDAAARGRGAQTALISARLELARRLGCDVVVTETGEAVEGHPNVSESNLRRQGFQMTYVRENWAPPGTTWAPPVLDTVDTDR